MFYQKNVPNWERAIRVAAGLGGAVLAYLSGQGWIMTVAIGSFALTGFFGFCPMCAMVGRKLDQQRELASKKI